jgi:hypothetical protein
MADETLVTKLTSRKASITRVIYESGHHAGLDGNYE